MEAEQLRAALRRVVLTHGMLDDARRPCGAALPVPHAYALMELSTGAMTVTELAARLSIDRTNVSRLCARLEAAGELRREVHPRDRRARLVSLTQKGQDAARAISVSSAKHFGRVATRLGPLQGRVLESLHLLADALEDCATHDLEREPT